MKGRCKGVGPVARQGAKPSSHATPLTCLHAFVAEVPENMVQREVDPAARALPASRQLSMKSSHSADMSVSMLSSEAWPSYCRSLSTVPNVVG